MTKQTGYSNERRCRIVGYYMIDALKQKAEAFVQSYLLQHPLNQQLDWEALLSVTTDGTRLHVMIYAGDRSMIVETRDFPL